MESQQMTDNQSDNTQWTDAERASVRKLLRMAGILFIAIIGAGIIAAFISSMLGTL